MIGFGWTVWLWFSTETGHRFFPQSVVAMGCRPVQDLQVFVNNIFLLVILNTWICLGGAHTYNLQTSKATSTKYLILKAKICVHILFLNLHILLQTSKISCWSLKQQDIRDWIFFLNKSIYALKCWLWCGYQRDYSFRNIMHHYPHSYLLLMSWAIILSYREHFVTDGITTFFHLWLRENLIVFKYYLAFIYIPIYSLTYLEN